MGFHDLPRDGQTQSQTRKALSVLFHPVVRFKQPLLFLRRDAQAVVFHALGHVGEAYTSSLPLDLVRATTTLLADTLDGGPLPPRHGGPLRLVVPKQLGYKNVKWVVRMEVTHTLVPGYWEQRGYPENAPAGE